MRRLTDVAYWEKNWWSEKRPERLWLYRDLDLEHVRLLQSAAGTRASLVIELGAGSSRILPYLGRKFGYKVCGSDFSLAGCRLLRANLALQKVNGNVIYEDLFQSSLKSQTFDMVYSSGLIEHFDDTRAVVAAHLRLLKPGGRLVLTVPNLQGYQGSIMRRLAPALWDVHRVFGPEELATLLKEMDFEQIRWGYLGSFFIRILRSNDWSVVRAWSPWVQQMVCSSMRLANGLISLGFRLSPWRPHSRLLSPMFFASGAKGSE